MLPALLGPPDKICDRSVLLPLYVLYSIVSSRITNAKNGFSISMGFLVHILCIANSREWPRLVCLPSTTYIPP